MYSRLIDVTVSGLRQKGKRQKPVKIRCGPYIGLSIAKRPREVRTRDRFGVPLSFTELYIQVTGEQRQRSFPRVLPEKLGLRDGR